MHLRTWLSVVRGKVDFGVKVSQLIWGREIEVLLEDIMTNRWNEIANNQLFALSSPRITVPQILEACNDSSEGFKNIAIGEKCGKS